MPKSHEPDVWGSDYKLRKVVGKGAYGTVWSGLERSTKKVVAIKHIDKVFDSHADAVRVLREMRLLRELRHPNIVTIRDVLLPRSKRSFNDVFLVFELFHTDLRQMIFSETKYDMTHRRWIMFQVMRGLAHMHKAGVFHRDLKPGNVLVNGNCDCKICDLGLARAQRPGQDMGEDLTLWTDYIASRWYRAPELICCYEAPYTAAIDVWSAGCVAAELLHRKPIFNGKNGPEQLDLITNMIGTPAPDEYRSLRSARARQMLQMMRKKRPADLLQVFPGTEEPEREFLASMLVFSSAKRITAEACMLLPFFDSIRDLKAARIPEIPIPDLTADPDATFVFDDVSHTATAQLRQQLYTEITCYHPDGEVSPDGNCLPRLRSRASPQSNLEDPPQSSPARATSASRNRRPAVSTFSSEVKGASATMEGLSMDRRQSTSPTRRSRTPSPNVGSPEEGRPASSPGSLRSRSSPVTPPADEPKAVPLPEAEPRSLFRGASVDDCKLARKMSPDMVSGQPE